MFRILNLEDIDNSKNLLAGEFIRFDRGDSKLDKLYFDTARANGTKITFTYNHQYSYDCRTEARPAEGLCPEFMSFLRQHLLPTTIDILSHQYDQGMISFANACIYKAIVDVHLKPIPDETLILDYQKKIDLYEDGNDLFIDVSTSHLEVILGGEDGRGRTVRETLYAIPGTVFVRYKIEENQTVLDKCTVDNALLHRLITEDRVEIGPKDIRQAENEVEQVKNLEIALSNRIYD